MQTGVLARMEVLAHYSVVVASSQVASALGKWALGASLGLVVLGNLLEEDNIVAEGIVAEGIVAGDRVVGTQAVGLEDSNQAGQTVLRTA